METGNYKPQYITYWRYKKEPIKKENGEVLMATTLFGSSILIFAVMYWKISLIFILSLLIAKVAKIRLDEYKENQTRAKLIVNEGNKSKVIYL